MSKILSIAEGGVGRQFGPVPRVFTPLKGGGDCAWVPEDLTEADAITITQNGTYDAAAMGVYGWTEATVNVTERQQPVDSDGNPWDVTIDDGDGGATISTDDGDTLGFGDSGPTMTIDDTDYPIDVEALGFDADGDTTLSWDRKKKRVNICGTYASTGKLSLGRYDPTTGDLTVTQSPDEIIITSLPSRTVYQSGKIIDYSGLQVSIVASVFSYTPIPFDELILPVTRASLDEAEAMYTTPSIEDSQMWKIYGKTFHYIQAPIGMTFIGNIVGDETHTRKYTLIASDGPVYAALARGTTQAGVPDYDYVELASLTAFDFEYQSEYGTISTIHVDIHPVHQFANYQIQARMDYNTFAPLITVPWASIYIQEDMVRLNTYGVKYYQTLPIQWARPCDGQMLEQAIMIEVTEAHYGSATGGGGGSAGGGAGRDQHN